MMVAISIAMQIAIERPRARPQRQEDFGEIAPVGEAQAPDFMRRAQQKAVGAVEDEVADHVPDDEQQATQDHRRNDRLAKLTRERFGLRKVRRLGSIGGNGDSLAHQ
ncbi:MAG: hypothetical protein J0H60_02770 [Rhizobiales bacterium]|nr:hypothetical protein [Hyphomicrobiales bacterium]